MDHGTYNGFYSNLQPLSYLFLQVTPVSSSTFSDATKVFVEPASADDWEILSIHAQYLEQQLINQVAIIRKNLTIPLWINTSTFIKVTFGMHAYLVMENYDSNMKMS